MQPAHVLVQAAMLAHEVAGNRSGAAGSADAPPGLQRRLTVPLFAVSSVTGSGIPLLHAFLSTLRPCSFDAAAPSVCGRNGLMFACQSSVLLCTDNSKVVNLGQT